MLDLDKEFKNEHFSLIHYSSGWVAIARDKEGRGETSVEALNELENKIAKR